MATSLLADFMGIWQKYDLMFLFGVREQTTAAAEPFMFESEWEPQEEGRRETNQSLALGLLRVLTDGHPPLLPLMFT